MLAGGLTQLGVCAHLYVQLSSGCCLTRIQCSAERRPGRCGDFREGRGQAWAPHREALLTTLPLQIDRYAQQDLKKGLHLYGTPGNVGLTNAWSIIQTDVRGQVDEGVGWPGLWGRRQEAW